MTTQLAIKNYDIQQISQMTEMSKILKTHIVEQKLYTTISSKNYVHVDGWQFAGGLMGLYPKIVKVENLSRDKEIKWSAEVEVIDMKTDKVISRGFAICSNLENKKKTFDEYAIVSMAQTRAIGKAFRNIIGWVMKLAGYESTPEEEIKNEVKETIKAETNSANKEKINSINTKICQQTKSQNHSTTVKSQ